MTVIEFNHISKAYQDGHPVIDDLSLSIGKNELVTILGPSGCGKTTLIKMVNKLLLPDEGEIYVHGKSTRDWDEIKLRRNIGYVIQHIGLLPHLTVEQNISFVLNLENKPEELLSSRSVELINLVGLNEGYLQRYPRALSGGQRQRVGVARALAANPEIILMDEPFGAVDEIARSHLQDQLLDIQSRLGKTILFVTHDIEEAFKLGSKIILMNAGKIEQIGTAEEMIYKPKTDFVESFLGSKGFKAVLREATLNEMYQEERRKYKSI